jgi:hypothetical protein
LKDLKRRQDEEERRRSEEERARMAPPPAIDRLVQQVGDRGKYGADEGKERGGESQNGAPTRNRQVSSASRR